MTRFSKIINVTFNHNYFAGKSFAGFEVQPLANCVDYLKRRDLDYKLLSNGFCIYISTEQDADVAAKLAALQEEAFVLQFALVLRSPDLYTYTANLPTDINGSVLQFKNYPDENGDAPFAGKLHVGEFVGTADAIPVTQLETAFFRKPFGIISIALNQQIPAIYSIDFAARSSIWRYILTGDTYKELDNLAIKTNTDINFTGPETASLPGFGSAVCFQSEAPIVLSQANNYKFQLIDKNPTTAGKFKVIKRALPMPDITRISRLESTNNLDFFYSEIYIN